MRDLPGELIDDFDDRKRLLESDLEFQEWFKNEEKKLQRYQMLLDQFNRQYDTDFRTLAELSEHICTGRCLFAIWLPELRSDNGQ